MTYNVIMLRGIHMFFVGRFGPVGIKICRLARKTVPPRGSPTQVINISALASNARLVLSSRNQRLWLFLSGFAPAGALGAALPAVGGRVLLRPALPESMPR